MRKNKKVIKLNANYCFLDLITTKRALSLYVAGKINIVLENEKLPPVHPRIKIRPPVAVVLREFKKVPYKKIILNRKNVFLRDGYKCQYCGKPLGKLNTATWDHVVPKSKHRGNRNTWDNLVTCCRKCNNRKGDRTPAEAGMKLARIPFIPRTEDIIIRDPQLKRAFRKIMGID